MKTILLVSPGSVIHTIKWVNGFAELGYDVHLATQHPPTEPINENVNVHLLPFSGFKGYFINAIKLNKLVNTIKPDVINVHYATGYGVLAMLASIRPYILSVWGSDVYVFPFKTPVHRWLVKRSLLSSHHIASTSLAMAKKTRSLIDQERSISITPFGVNTDQFVCTRPPFSSEGKIVIGTVKALEDVYGIDVLIKGFSELVNQFPGGCKPSTLQLKIVGTGSKLNELQSLVEELELQSYVSFVGRIPNIDVPKAINSMDIFVVSSRVESFGVAAVEASACERVCVVSDTGGLPEVVLKDDTGYLFERESSHDLAQVLLSIVKDKKEGLIRAKRAREHVLSAFSEQSTLLTMEKVLGTFCVADDK